MVATVMALVGFLSGSVPFGWILTRLVAGQDVRAIGSGNIGAANVARAAGTRTGIAVAVLDVLKGVIPVAVAEALGVSHAGLALVGMAAVLGHDFSIFLRFRGGKGVATSLGIGLALAPIAGVLAAVVWVVLLFLVRYTSLASLGALAFLPLFMQVTRQPGAYVLLATALFVLAALKHWDNVARLLRGVEPRFREGTGDDD